MTIGITNDHRGVNGKQILTEYLTALGYNVVNYGTNSTISADFPDYAKKLGEGILNKEVELGLVGTKTENSYLIFDPFYKDKLVLITPISKKYLKRFSITQLFLQL